MSTFPNSLQPAEVMAIAESLQLHLPADYVDTLVQYPFPAECPFAEFLLYARPEQVVERNLRARTHRFFGHPWPEQFLIIGDFANGDVIFLDTTRARTSVLVASHELTSAAELAVEDTGFELIEWASGVLEAWRRQK